MTARRAEMAAEACCVGPGQLAAIKDNAVLINAGRARLVQGEALLSELKKYRFTAILDVHYQEPLGVDSPFRTLPNVIMTPHCAGFPGRDRYVGCVLEEFDRLFRGLPLQHEVTPERAAGMTNDLLRKCSQGTRFIAPLSGRGLVDGGWQAKGRGVLG